MEKSKSIEYKITWPLAYEVKEKLKELTAKVYLINAGEVKLKQRFTWERNQ